MPGNEAYNRLLEFIMPSWDSPEIDVELRVVGILGMQGSGKTTLVQTIVSDLKKEYQDLVTVYGFWLHDIIDTIKRKGLNTMHSAVVLEDATTRYHVGQARSLIARDMKVFWRLRHLLRQAGLNPFTGKITVIVVMHSYMTVNKYLRNSQALIIKSMAPKWQRFEHEDVTLRWLDSSLVNELTRMRYEGGREQVEKALNKALVVYMDGRSELLSFKAVKKWPQDTIVVEENEESDQNSNDSNIVDSELLKDIRSLARSLARLRDNNSLFFSDTGAYIRIDGKKIRLGSKRVVRKLLSYVQ